jgi:hypothetical protein
VCADDETVCLHGSTCSTSVTATGQTQYVCDCPQPYLGGSGCRGQERMELCNPHLAPEYTFGMALPAFCLNGGTCKDVVNGDATVYVKQMGSLGESQACQVISHSCIWPCYYYYYFLFIHTVTLAATVRISLRVSIASCSDPPMPLETLTTC